MNLLESQIETRSRLDDELIERAYLELASSIGGPKITRPLSIDSAEKVDAAVAECLRYLGVEPGKAPDSVKDEEERIEWLCRPSATMRRVVTLDAGWQSAAFGSMLGHLDTGEPVALIPNHYHYTYINPEDGSKVTVTKEVAKHLDQQAILFYKPLPQKPLKISDLIAFIFSIFDLADYEMVIGSALIATLIGFIPAWANKIAFGTVVPSGQAELIAPITALLLGMSVSTTLISICRSLAMARVSTKIDVVCGAATFARMLALPPSFFKNYSSGNLSSRLHLITSLSQTIVSIFLGSGLSAVLALSYLFQIGAYASSLVLPSLIIVVAQAVLTVAVTVMTNKYEREASEASAALSGTVTALLNGIQKIKLAGAENRAFSKWAHSYSQYAQPVYNRPILMRALPAFVSLISMLGTIFIYFLAGSSGVSVSDYMAFNAAFGQVAGAIMTLAGIAEQIVQIRPTLEMVEPILEATPETAEDKPSVEAITGGVDVADVTFRYDDSSPYVLKNLSFRIHPNEYVAIVGKSGCGKSTILRLLLGFETPERGTIFYGPHDVSKIDLRSLRKHIGVVTQDGKLFLGDLFSNITISTPQATLDDAWEAAEIAGIADDIRKMPMGMQTLVTEGGGGISGGQRQRIMIARAVCGKRRILMFDEATSALDNVTQRHVADALANLRCTRIVIAHRLSTVRHCDRILVVSDGHIAEEGTYEELIANGGLFADLVERQRLDKET